MIQYKKETQEVDVIDFIECDGCKKIIKTVGDEVFEAQEVLHINQRTGYGNTAFGDDIDLQADLCQHCVKKLLGSVLRVTDHLFGWNT